MERKTRWLEKLTIDNHWIDFSLKTINETSSQTTSGSSTYATQHTDIWKHWPNFATLGTAVVSRACLISIKMKSKQHPWEQKDFGHDEPPTRPSNLTTKFVT